jgi:hypothetical protein
VYLKAEGIQVAKPVDKFPSRDETDRAPQRDNNASRSSSTAINIPSVVRFYLSALFLIRSSAKGGEEQQLFEQTQPLTRHNGQLSSFPASTTPNRCARYGRLVGRVEVARRVSLLNHPFRMLITFVQIPFVYSLNEITDKRRSADAGRIILAKYATLNELTGFQQEFRLIDDAKDICACAMYKVYLSRL